jgi:hypothetical protein
MWFSGHTVRRLHVQVNLDRQVRLVMIGSRPVTSGHWLDVDPGDTIEVAIDGDTEANRFVATATLARSDRRSVVTAPMTEWNHQFRSIPVTPAVALRGAAEAEQLGMRISAAAGPVPEVCDRLR